MNHRTGCIPSHHALSELVGWNKSLVDFIAEASPLKRAHSTVVNKILEQARNEEKD